MIIFHALHLAVAFKFVIGDSIPKVSYTTMLDRYVMSSFLLLFAIMVTSGTMAALLKHNITPQEDIESIDVAIGVVLFALWFGYNGLYAGKTLYQHWYQTSES